MKLLKRFWFRFGNSSASRGLKLGCGVTAYDRDDAMKMLNDSKLGQEGLPQILEVIEDIKIPDLDAGHVVPNIGDVTVRGIWFPRGFDLIGNAVRRR